MAVVYLGLGSNLGDRAANLQEALRRLEDGEEIRVRRVTPFRSSEPFGVTEQPSFLNSVAEIETTLPPRALLERAKRIEREMGRAPTFRWGPRLIDIDLLHYEGVRLAEPDLTLPHPGILERDFVWHPLAELAPRVVEELRRNAGKVY